MSNFNQQKNLKAGTYTVLLLGSLLALCFIISWTSPITPPIQEEEGMEVNLGDSETGSGDIQPLLPGDPALETETVQTPPPQATETAPAEKEIETNEDDKEAPPAVVTKPKEEIKPKPKVELKPAPETPKPVTKPKEEPKADKTLLSKGETIEVDLEDLSYSLSADLIDKDGKTVDTKSVTIPAKKVADPTVDPTTQQNNNGTGPGPLPPQPMMPDYIFKSQGI